jgi:hypothetical protein
MTDGIAIKNESMTVRKRINWKRKNTTRCASARMPLSKRQGFATPFG